MARDSVDRSRRVAVSMIAGDGWVADEIKVLLESLEPHCHALYVNWNGTKRKPRWGNWTSMPVHYMTSTWEDDFAKARNDSYRMIPKDQYGWWLWIDTDDKLVAPDGFDPLWEGMDSYTRAFILRYAYGIEPNTGMVVVEQERERLFSLDWVWMWKWPIHEICAAPQGTQVVRAAQGELGQKVFIEHLRKNGEDRGARERNRRIIAKAYRQDPNESRFAFYLANEAKVAADDEEAGPRKTMLCDAAIVAYRNFLRADNMSDLAYSAGCRIGDLFMEKEDFTGALDAYLQAARAYPDWADAWVGCAMALMRSGDFRRMRSFANIALGLSRPDTTVALDARNYSFTPIFLRAIASEELGDLKAALDDYKKARKIYNDPEARLDSRIRAIQRRLRQAPKADPLDERKRLRGTKPEKSICFFTNPIHETWNQKTLHAGGHGGAETLVLEMAPRFAADGWRVAVFGCPGDAIGIGDDGVEYWRSEDWLPMEPWTVFVASRAMTPFAGPVESKLSFLWMHDVNLGPAMRQVVGRPTKIVPISNWHRNHLQALYGIPDSHMHVIPNGIDLASFPEVEDADGHRFIWSSSPDRGLEYLLGLWPMVRELWPDAELEVFYGWEFIDKILKHQPNHPLGALKYRVATQWINMGGEESGLHWMDRVAPSVLAEHQLKADFWAYPTGFMETFCLTAIQAQAAGTIPITTALAALNENVACEWLRVAGWPGNSDFQSRYMETLQVLLDDTPEAAALRAQARRVGRKYAKRFSLDASYAKWNDLFIECGLEV